MALRQSDGNVDQTVANLVNSPQSYKHAPVGLQRGDSGTGAASEQLFGSDY